MTFVTSDAAASVDAVGVAVVGFGYWGPNLARNVIERPELNLVAVCEQDRTRHEHIALRAPGTTIVDELAMALANPAVEAVLIATPPASHEALADQAMAAGRHVLVEKPLALTAESAYRLAARAEERGVVLMPGHTFLYSPPVQTIRQTIQSGGVGDIHFVTSTRMNLGKYQDLGVIWDLLPHDLSILLHVLDDRVVEVQASGRCIFRPGVPEVAFVTLTFASGTTANIQLSWLAPRKIRDMLFVGSDRMIQFDDSAADESVRIYDRGMDVKLPETFGEHQLTYRSGDILIPRIAADEPLGLQLAAFADAVRNGGTPRSTARLGADIIAVIEAAMKSLELDRPVMLTDVP